jgi:hypothetical protein
MDSPKDTWHFARPLLAKQYLGEFDLGLMLVAAPEQWRMQGDNPPHLKE